MKRSVISRLAHDRGGNFGIMTAVMLPVLLGLSGVAIDVTQAVQMKSQLQGFADSAALAAATAMAQKGTSPIDAQALAKSFLAAQLMEATKNGSETDAEMAALAKEYKDSADVTATQITTTSGKEFTVNLSMNYDLKLNAMTQLFAGSTMKIGVASSAASTSVADTAISMYLALDRSGSMSFKTDEKNPLIPICDNYTSDSWPNSVSQFKMPGCYIRKIQALQTAASGLFTSLNKSDPKGNLVRVGAVSYTDETQKASDITWGTLTSSAYVTLLPYKPTGGTNAKGAMQIAYDALKLSNTTEATAHKGKGHSKYHRYILLMTDGEMTGSSASWNSGIDKDVRALCDKAKLDGDTNKNGKIDGDEEGITIFTVAFMAPTRGKDLLNYCASGSENYYEPDDMNALVAAFGEIAEKAAKTTTRLTN